MAVISDQSSRHVLSDDVRNRSAARPNWGWLALLLLALIAAAPLWSGPGLVNTRAGGDSPFLFIRLHQLVENLRAGVLPARWMPDAAYGLGYPFFNFYAALPYYFAAAFALIGLDVLASLKIVQSLGFVLAAWAMVGWGRSSFGGRAQACLAAAAYTVAPFHLVNVYVRGDSLSEFYAFVFYPLILWAVDRVAERPRPRSVALLGLAYGGLILTHNISALIFTPFVLLYMVIRDWRLEIGDWRLRRSSHITHHAPRTTHHAPRTTHHAPRITHNTLHSLTGLLLGLLISAWFWLPALGEAPLVQLDAQTTGYFNYAGHFRSTDLVEPSLGFDYSTEPPHTPFAIGLAQAFVTLAGVVATLVTWKRGLTRLRVFTLAGLIVSTLMITPLSKPLWDTLPLLPLVQFPWRFLSVQALFASLAASFLVYAGGAGRGETSQRLPEDSPPSLPRAEPKGHQGTKKSLKLLGVLVPWWLLRRPFQAGSQSWIAAGVALALAASTLLTLRPDYLPIRADEIGPERIHAYEAFTTNVGTTIRAEYLPRTTIPRPYTGPTLIDPAAPPRAIPVRGEAEAVQVARGPVSQSWSVRAADDAALAFPTLHFAGWQASLDGQRVEARAAADLGTIEVDMPEGEHRVTLWLDRTPLRAGAELVSLAAALVTIGMLIFARRESGVRVRVGVRVRAMDRPQLVARLRSFIAYRRYELALLALACLFAAIAAVTNAVEAGEDDLVMDFESKPWLHHGGADFGVARLARYTYAEPSTVVLEWSDVAGADAWAVVQLVAPSSHAFGGPEPLASARAPIRAGTNTVTLDVPERLSRGMVYVRVEVADASRVYGSTFLRPLFYPGSGAAIPAAGWAPIGDEIELRVVTVEHDSAERLTVAFDWTALKSIAANYAVSLRLADAAGRVWASLDTQPGYGFLPTSTWLPGENQHDAYTLSLPLEAPHDEVYSLDVVWYRVASQEEMGRVRVPGIKIDTLYDETEAPPPQRSFAIPSMQHRVDATFGDQIRLLGYDLAQEGSRFILTLHWQALADMGADYKYFVHVFDPATERIVAQIDAAPGGNAYPTSWWTKGEVVSERVELELELEEEPYRVATGWYDPVSGNRLPAIDAQGNPTPSDRLLLDEAIRSP
ncbi:MAG TPA: glycosyltransferase family 39 protein [Anaerolineae bacterium]|nr:glycosyltransferase family 39 protein [Anaerolineae bacterium]